jgi:glycosyltransferase involved in cell wall biosynthesis
LNELSTAGFPAVLFLFNLVIISHLYYKVVKKVLVDLGKLKDLNSGLGQVSYNLGHELSQTNMRELNLEYLIPAGFENQFGSQVSYAKLSLLKRWFPFLNKNYDLWHAIHQDSGFMPPASVPYLLTIHDLNFMYEKSQAKAQTRLDALKHKISRANHITFISKFAEEETKKFVDLKGKRTSVIYNGVKAPDFTNVSKPDRLPERNFLFTIGVVRPKKNFSVLIEMMRQLKDFSLVIAGNDNHVYADEIREKIAQYKLEDRVVLLGSISEQEKNYLYKECAAFVFPSLYEGFGLPVIEAMHAGKPVFSSTCTSLPEIGKDFAFYWNSFDAKYMAEVVENGMVQFNANALILSEQYKKHAAAFSWKENAAAYIELYKKITQQFS